MQSGSDCSSSTGKGPSQVSYTHNMQHSPFTSHHRMHVHSTDCSSTGGGPSQASYTHNVQHSLFTSHHRMCVHSIDCSSTRGGVSQISYSHNVQYFSWTHYYDPQLSTIKNLNAYLYSILRVYIWMHRFTVHDMSVLSSVYKKCAWFSVQLPLCPTVYHYKLCAKRHSEQTLHRSHC